MAKTRQQKKEIVKSLEEALKNMKGGVFADFTGLKVNEVEELRDKLREVDARFIVTKRTLFKIALEKAGLSGVNIDAIEGPISLATSSQDEVASAKALAQFAKEHEALKIKGGILESKFIDFAKVEELAKLPSKSELLAQVVGSIRAPISGFVRVLEGNLQGLVRVLDAVRESKA